MTDLVHFSPIGSANAKDISRLQRRLFPRALQESQEELRQILAKTEQHMVCNLSIGIYDGTRMVGYVFAYVESKSVFYTRKEEVIYIKEIVLLPAYEKCFRRLLIKIYEHWSVFTPGLAIEAHALADALENWRRLGQTEVAVCLPAFLGYLETRADDWDIFDIDEQIEGPSTDAVRLGRAGKSIGILHESRNKA